MIGEIMGGFCLLRWRGTVGARRQVTRHIFMFSEFFQGNFRFFAVN
jgi:hypothetical protein